MSDQPFAVSREQLNNGINRHNDFINLVGGNTMLESVLRAGTELVDEVRFLGHYAINPALRAIRGQDLVDRVVTRPRYPQPEAVAPLAQPDLGTPNYVKFVGVVERPQPAIIDYDAVEK